jgi:ribosomal protein L37AE/L43A
VNAPSGQHTCPNCQRSLRLRFSWFYAGILLLVTGLCSAPGAILLSYWLGGFWPVLGVIPSLFVVFPLDKLFDDKYRRLRALQQDEPSSTAVCVECKGSFSVESMIAHNGVYVCARCKPIFLQKLKEGATIGTATEEPRRNSRDGMVL